MLPLPLVAPHATEHASAWLQSTPAQLPPPSQDTSHA